MMPMAKRAIEPASQYRISMRASVGSERSALDYDKDDAARAASRMSRPVTMMTVSFYSKWWPLPS